VHGFVDLQRPGLISTLPNIFPLPASEKTPVPSPIAWRYHFRLASRLGRADLAPALAKSELAQAFRYMRARWTALVRWFDDGRLAFDNNPAERALRCVATRRSLCPPSSSLWKHWNLTFGVGATRATCSLDRISYPFVLQIRRSDLVRSKRYNLLGGENAVLDQPANAVMRDAERRRGFGHRQPFAALLGRNGRREFRSPAALN
jgi:hypothetical protein